MSTSKQSVVASVKNAASQGQISVGLAEDIIERLDDIAIAGCAGVNPDEIDSEEATLVSVIIDESGSMDQYRQQVIDEYNESFLKPLQGAKQAESIHVSTMVFSDVGGRDQVRLIHSYKPVKQCPKLTKRDYAPDGGTPLFRAVQYGLTGIFDYGNTLQNSGTRVKRIVVVISDGQENASGNFTTSAKLKKFSQELLATESCVLSYVFMGIEAEGDKYAKEIGFPPNHRLTEDVRKSGGASAIRRIFGTLSASVITASQSSVSAAGLSANAFFTSP